MFSKRRFFVCSVCGYERLPGPLYDKSGIADISLICACCGFQPGYDDEESGYTFESYRTEWIENGATWFVEKKKPKKWSLQDQLKNLNGSS